MNDFAVRLLTWIGGFALGFALGINATPVLFGGKRSIRIGDRQYIAEKESNETRIWKPEYPEYYVLREDCSRGVWSICTTDEKTVVYPRHKVLRTICAYGTKKAVRALEEYIFDETLAPEIRHDKLLEQYLGPKNTKKKPGKSQCL